MERNADTIKTIIECLDRLLEAGGESPATPTAQVA